MKTLISKLIILLSVVFVMSLPSSCIGPDYVDCENAQVEIINNSNYYVYYADPFSGDDYCYPDNWIEPGGSIIIPYGEIHTTSDMGEYIEFYYRFNGPGYSHYALDVEIEYCNNIAYINY